MPNQTELTLGDLARIALGSTCLGPSNVAVLHSLIDLLLKKLNCRDEKVSIGGYESRCLRKLLENTKIPSYSFQEDQLEIVTDKFDRIDALEERVEKVTSRLEKHFDEIRECNNQNVSDVFQYHNWEHYAGACEDLCQSCEPENKIACELLLNSDFMKKVLRRVSFPLIERLFNFEQQVVALHDDFEKFMEKTRDHYMKMALVERCIQEIEHLRRQVDDHHLQFLGAMEEVQDMFDAKLDKIHLPALKKYVRDRFDSIEQLLESLRQPTTCPESGGVILEGIKCLSCGNERVCSEKTILIKGVMPEMHPKKKNKIEKKYCGCMYPTCSKVAEHMFTWTAQGRGNVEKKQGLKKSCKTYDYELKPGRDGVFYRMDAQEDLDEKSEEKLKDKCEEKSKEKPEEKSEEKTKEKPEETEKPIEEIEG